METLRSGSRGPNVELLQLALSRAGYDPGNIDGVFGPRTRAAVVRFQSANGLTPDGIVGMRTWPKVLQYIRGFIPYTIARGDTLWALSRRYGADLDAIYAANPGVDPRNLQVGQPIVIPLPFSIVPTNISYTSELVYLVLEGLAARYPALRVNSIGRSVLGREIYEVTLGNGPTAVGYNAAHHANEWITTPLLLRFLEQYAQAVAEGGLLYGIPAARLFSAATLHAVPLVNPDGVDLVNDAFATNSGVYREARALAANYPSVPFPSGWKANIAGVDLNLNYPAQWERARELKFAQGFTRPGPREYVGTRALSEPESIAMYNWTRARNFQLVMALHTQGEEIYWTFDNIQPVNGEAWGRAFAAASGYRLGVPDLDSSFAGYKDWFIQDTRRPGYTIEAGRGTSPLPLSQFNSIYRDLLGILTLGIALPAGVVR